MNSSIANLVEQGNKCPYYQLIEMKIEEVRKDYARLSIEIERKHTQFFGTVHGGVTASLADSAAAWAIYGSGNLGGSPVTVEMKINFLKPIRKGTLIAEARNLHKGSRIFVSDVEVKDSEGVLVAKSLVTYLIVKDVQ
jgi:uncharacterized protein (TIGR00369 family)